MIEDELKDKNYEYMKDYQEENENIFFYYSFIKIFLIFI